MNIIIKTVFAIFLINIYWCDARSNSKFFPYAWNVPAFPIKAIAIMKGQIANPATSSFNKIVGTILFQQDKENGPVCIKLNITGLLTGAETKHGLHVHTNGITTTSDAYPEICISTGGHYNPENKTHGGLTSHVRHVGDYGNVVKSADGTIVTQITDKVSQLYGVYSIVGRAIVLHQNEDDLGSNRTNAGSLLNGNSGVRIACGVIGYIS